MFTLKAGTRPGFVQIFFNEKPDQATIAEIKAAGFKFAISGNAPRWYGPEDQLPMKYRGQPIEPLPVEGTHEIAPGVTMAPFGMRPPSPFQIKLEAFRAMLEETFNKAHYDSALRSAGQDTANHYLKGGKLWRPCTIKYGKKYVNVDFGGSGVYMVDQATGQIFGIKGYGKVHDKHRYGTLDTIDQWQWNQYGTCRKDALETLARQDAAAKVKDVLVGGGAHPSMQVSTAPAGPGCTAISITPPAHPQVQAPASQLDKFMAAYEPQLIRAHKENPDIYKFPADQIPQVLDRMRAAIKAGSYNHEGIALQRTCKALGIKHTRKAITEFLNDKGRPEPGKVYNLTGFANGEKSIAKGNTWAESEVKPKPPKMKLKALSAMPQVEFADAFEGNIAEKNSDYITDGKVLFLKSALTPDDQKELANTKYCGPNPQFNDKKRVPEYGVTKLMTNCVEACDCDAEIIGYVDGPLPEEGARVATVLVSQDVHLFNAEYLALIRHLLHPDNCKHTGSASSNKLVFFRDGEPIAILMGLDCMAPKDKKDYKEATLHYKNTPEPDLGSAPDAPVELPAEPEAVAAPTGPRSWKVGIKTSGDKDWGSNAMRYATKAEAEQAAADLALRWFAVTEWTVLESDDAVYPAPKVEQPAPAAEPVVVDAPKPNTPHDAQVALKKLEQYIGKSQRRCVIEGMRGEEKQFFIDKMIEMAKVVEEMPKTYDQDGMGGKAMVHLHYFTGGCDWYITEKDQGSEQLQAFGLADLGMGEPELGYISLQEILGCNAELDFHWTPKTIDQVRNKHSAPPEPEPEHTPEPTPIPPAPATNVVSITSGMTLAQRLARIRQTAASAV